MTSHWKRLVVKVGSALIAQPSGAIDPQQLDVLVAQVAALMAGGAQIVLVSSGAIAAGMASLDYQRRPTELRKLQAAASVGQGVLMRMYEERFRTHGRLVGQVLLTPADLAARARYLNARHTLETLLAAGVVPIVNENDAVAVDEIKFGDNDRLSALVAHVVDADALIILTDVDGFLQHGALLERVEHITPELEQWARGPKHRASQGGMATKLQAARLAMQAGIPMVLANGRREGILREIISGRATCTWFLPQPRKLTVRKRWLAFGSLRAHGRVVVDAGARTALIERHTSLLPSGVVGVSGRFTAGDVVTISDESQQDIGRGIVNFSAEDLQRIQGLHTREIARVLGARAAEEVVHRNHLVITVERGL